MTARDDRSSALLVALPFGRIFPEADGGIEALDRQQLSLLYRPIPATDAIPATPEAVVNTSIENWYVIDYTARRPRPVTAIEWRFMKEVFAVWRRSTAKARRNERVRQALERRFNRELQPRRRTPRDLYARPSTRAANPGNVRPNIRGQLDGRRDSRAPHSPIRSAPGARGRH